MGWVVNKSTKELKTSVHTPAYPPSDWLIDPDLSAVQGVPQKYWKISNDLIVEMNDTEKAAADAALAQAAAIVYTKNLVDQAMNFGNELMLDFTAENVRLGITQAGMTRVVRERTTEVRDCLYTGSLYDAIGAIKSVPEEHKDPVFITNARLLSVLNRIEAYLKLPLSSTL